MATVGNRGTGKLLNDTAFGDVRQHMATYFTTLTS
jgi:hypothetical protein